jgi:hypothetical protein
MTAEENTILQEARKILLERGQGTSGLMEMGHNPNQTIGPQAVPAQSAQRVPAQECTTQIRQGNPLFQTAQGPNVMDSEDAVSEGFTVVEPDFVAQMEDAQILEQLRQLEEATNMLQLTL